MAACIFAVCGPGGHAAAADPAKVLRVVFNIAETSFDPQFASDAASDSIIENIYEAMLDYDYLARPLQLVPRTLEAMPTVEDNGATYVFRLKKGIHFTKEGQRLLRTERYSGSVYRAFTLPVEIDESASNARYENGVLELTLTKKPAVAGRKLTIQ